MIRRVAVFTVALSAVPFDLYCTDHMIEKSLSPGCKLVGAGSQQPATSRTCQYHHSILRFTLFILGVILMAFRPPLTSKRDPRLRDGDWERSQNPRDPIPIPSWSPGPTCKSIISVLECTKGCLFVRFLTVVGRSTR